MATLSSIITPTNVLTASSTATLTNKTIDAASNTIIGISSEMLRVARTSNTIIGAANNSNLIDITSGTFTQTFDACSTLGDGFFCYIRNSGTGDITLDPNSSETIDGLTSYIMYPGEVRLVQCDGTALRTVVLNTFYRTFTASGTFTKPPGYSSFSGLLWGAGGSGGNGGSGGRGSGGGGGACLPFTIAASVVGTSETVTIGAGGTAITTSPTDGNAGGNSTLGSLATSYGGGGGGGTPSAANLSGGGGGGVLGAGGGGGAGSSGGGQPTTLTGTSNSGFGGGGTTAGGGGVRSAYGGGSGSGSGASGTTANFTGGASLYGGGGGGGQAISGTTSAGGTSVYGGAGGGGSTTASGSDGVAPGGGGGGTITGTTSGAGARGELRIWGIV